MLESRMIIDGFDHAIAIRCSSDETKFVKIAKKRG